MSDAAVKLLKVRVVAVQASDTNPQAPIVERPEDVARVARALLPTDREGFAVMHLDSRGAVRSIELVSVGTLNQTLVHPREVFKGAILANANAIILCHNHPSGVPLPSPEDKKITERLHNAGDVLGIDVADHVIVTGSGFYSMRRGR